MMRRLCKDARVVLLNEDFHIQLPLNKNKAPSFGNVCSSKLIPWFAFGLCFLILTQTI